MASTIGIKTANGEFYPIFEENSAVKKRLILTTVHNKQASVHIDLYKSDNQTITDDGYIGSLVVEHIKGKPSGAPSIELVISSNEAGEIIAEAADLDAAPKGEHQYLTVSLTSPELEESEPQDFAVDEYEDVPPAGLYEPLDTGAVPWVRLILIILCIIAVCFGVWFFLLSNFGSQREPSQPAATEIPAVSDSPGEEVQDAVMPELESEATTEPEQAEPELESEATIEPEQAEPELEPEEVTTEPEPVIAAIALEPELAVSESPAVPPAAAGPPVIEAPASPLPQQAAPNLTRTRPPAASYKAPAAIPRGGVAYKIRWGDTLWDISEAFYRNPWLYQRIARFNKIRNSDLIISGRTIRIPPKR